MKKYIITLFVILMTVLTVSASELDKIIENSPVSKSATISVSVRKLSTGNVVYAKDENKLLHPASTLKAFTFPVIYNQLGENYGLATQIYKVGKDTVYLKLGADPNLTSRDVRHLVRALRNFDVKQPQKFYIDDFIIDDKDFGTGWQLDDEVSNYTPKFSSYNMDRNCYTLAITTDGKTIKISHPESYNVSVINRLRIGNENKIFVQRNFWEGLDKVTLIGTVKSNTSVEIANYNQKRYFLSSLKDSLDSANVRFYGSFESKKVPSDATFIQEYVTPVTFLYPSIMKNSNNMITETLFKIAGGKYKNTQGTTLNGIEAFNNYYKQIGVDTSNIIVADASGVSRNNLISTDWMTNALYNINKNDKNFDYKKQFNLPNEGTMENRLFDLRDYLWAKTGTLSGVSGLTGYITSKDGNEYAFAILIQNSNLKKEDLKKLEDDIVMTVYKKY